MILYTKIQFRLEAFLVLEKKIFKCFLPYVGIAAILINRPLLFHYENTPIQVYWKFHHQKLKVFR